MAPPTGVKSEGNLAIDRVRDRGEGRSRDERLPTDREALRLVLDEFVLEQDARSADRGIVPRGSRPRDELLRAAREYRASATREDNLDLSLLTPVADFLGAIVDSAKLTGGLATLGQIPVIGPIAAVALAGVAALGVGESLSKVIDDVAGADLVSNRNAVVEAGYLESLDRLGLKQIPEGRRSAIDKMASDFNPLTDDLGKIRSSLSSQPEDLYFSLTLYNKLGGRSDSLSKKLQATSRGKGIADPKEQVTAVSEALTSQIRQIHVVSAKLSAKLGELRLVADEKSKWSIVQELLRSQIPGLNTEGLWNRVSQPIRKPKGAVGQDYTVDSFRARIREELNKAVQAEVPHVDLAPELFEGSPAPTFTEDNTIVSQVASDADRARTSGHTLGDSYLHRHITPEILEFLKDNPDVTIRIYDGPPGKALHDLQRAGLTDVRRLSENKLTDFQKYIARNPLTGETVLAVVGPQGRAYSREIASHFLYGDKAIGPERIRVFRSPGRAKDEFTATLRRTHVDPDALIIGNVEQFGEEMKERGVSPSREINEPNLFGYVYEVNGKSVLSVKVEPHLYADRAGEFVRAVLGQSSKKRSVFFTGTAGSLREDIHVSDLVVPNVFADANGLASTSVEGVENDAIGMVRDAHLERDGVFSGGRLGAVDTIMTEDKGWFGSHTSGDTRLDIVEQEGAGIAQAVAEHRAVAGNEAPVVFGAVYRISDNLVTGEDFAGNESNRAPSRSGLSQRDFFDAVLTRTFGSDLHGTPAEAQYPSALKKGKGATRYQITPRETGPGSPKLALDIGGMETLELVDPGAAQSLLSQADRIVSGLRVRDGKVENQTEVLRDFANLALEYQGQFGIKVTFSLSDGSAQQNYQSAAE